MASSRTRKRKQQRIAAKHRRLHPPRYVPDAVKMITRIMRDYYTREIVEQLHHTTALYDRLRK